MGCLLIRHTISALDKFTYKRSIDILALQETNVDSLDHNVLCNKTTFLNNNGRGVSLSINNTLHPQHITLLEEVSCSTVWVLTNVEGKKLLLGSVYCNPDPTTESFKSLLLNIKKAWSYCTQKGIPSMMVLGDYNARSSVWGDRIENPRGRLLREFVEQHAQCTMTSPEQKTFVCPNGGSVIDVGLIFGSISKNLGHPWVEKQDIHELFTGAPIRGHYPVMQHCIISANMKTPTVQVLDYARANWKLWRSELQTLFENKLSDIQMLTVDDLDIQDLYLFIQNAIKDASERYIPYKTCCKHSKPYWSKNLSSLSDNLREAQKKYLSQSTPLNKQLFDDSKDIFKSTLIKEKYGCGA